MALVRVLVIDDMTLVRQGILSLLKDRDSVNIIGEAPDVREATALMGQLEPDVILLDQDMPDLGTAEAVTLLKQQHPKVEVIVLSESADEERAFQVL